MTNARKIPVIPLIAKRTGFHADGIFNPSFGWKSNHYLPAFDDQAQQFERFLDVKNIASSGVGARFTSHRSGIASATLRASRTFFEGT